MKRNARLEELYPKIVELVKQTPGPIYMNPYACIMIDIELYLADCGGGGITDVNLLIEAAENALNP